MTVDNDPGDEYKPGSEAEMLAQAMSTLLIEDTKGNKIGSAVNTETSVPAASQTSLTSIPIQPLPLDEEQKRVPANGSAPLDEPGKAVGNSAHAEVNPGILEIDNTCPLIVPKSKVRPPKKCRRCQEVGHYARDCTNEKKCAACSQYGHTKPECLASLYIMRCHECFHPRHDGPCGDESMTNRLAVPLTERVKTKWTLPQVIAAIKKCYLVSDVMYHIEAWIADSVLGAKKSLLNLHDGMLNDVDCQWIVLAGGYETLMNLQMYTMTGEPAGFLLVATPKICTKDDITKEDPVTCFRLDDEYTDPPNIQENRRRIRDCKVGRLFGKCPVFCTTCCGEFGETEKCRLGPLCDICSYCKAEGHTARACPNKTDPDCIACGGFDHDYQLCDSIEAAKYREMTCQVCMTSEHTFRECPDFKKTVLAAFTRVEDSEEEITDDDSLRCKHIFEE